MRQLLDEAAKGGYGVGAFNVNDMEQIQAIMEAAKETQSPVIIQASRGARQFAQDRYLFHLILAASELYPDIPIAMHQDHGNSFETCKSAIELGFTSVMMDGSLKADGKTPASFEENVEVTRKVVDFAHERGVTVEGEIGVLGGVEDGHGAGGSGLDHITDPGPGSRVCRADRRGCAGDRHRHQPRRLQVHQEAGRFRSEDGRTDRDPQAPAQDAPGDARQFVRTRRTCRTS